MSTTQQEKQEQANTLRQQAETIRVLVEQGFDKSAALSAVCEGDLYSLKD